MIRIRNLDEDDRDALSAFVAEIYREYPAAMWFEKEPDPEILARLFSHKLSGIAGKNVVDIVAVHTAPDGRESIVGEAEIARLSGAVGYAGIIVKMEHRGKGLATQLLLMAYDQASALGMHEIRAEVAEANSAARRLFEKHGFAFVKSEEANGARGKIKLLLFSKTVP